MKANNSMIQKLQKTVFGRVISRLAGEERGAVMMEYVILAVLIAAAAVVAIAYFGKTIVGQTNVAATAAAGNGLKAGTTAQQVQQKQNTYQQEAVDASKNFSDTKAEAVKANN